MSPAVDLTFPVSYTTCQREFGLKKTELFSGLKILTKKTKKQNIQFENSISGLIAPSRASDKPG